MSIAAKVLPSLLKWINPDFQPKKVTTPSTTAFPINNKICWGFEEWNFNPKMLEMKMGYLDCFRRDADYNNLPVYNNVQLFYRDPKDENTYAFAVLKNVQKISHREVPQIREQLNNQNWLDEVENHFGQYPEQFEIYNRNYQNNNTFIPIDERPYNIFPFNIRYERICYYKEPIKVPYENNKRLFIRYCSNLEWHLELLNF